MENRKGAFIFHLKWIDALVDYPAEVRYEVYDAIIGYAQSGTLSELKPLAKMAFSFIKKDMDEDIEKYHKVCERNRENGKNGGRPKNPENPVGFLETQENPNNPNEPKKTDYDYDNDNDNDLLFKQSEIALSESASGTPTQGSQKIDFDKLVSYFNNKTQGVFGRVRMPLGENRKKMVRARINQFGKQSFVEMIEKAMASDFLKGQNSRGFTATFDWLICPSNYEKVLSGNYDNNTFTEQPKGRDVIGTNFTSDL